MNEQKINHYILYLLYGLIKKSYVKNVSEEFKFIRRIEICLYEKTVKKMERN